MPRIIDCHLHCSELPDDALYSFAKFNVLKYTFDELLELMKAADVEKGLLLSPPTNDGPPVPNQRIIDLCAKSGGVLYPILTAEPSVKDVTRSMRLAKENKGVVKGFKIRLGYVEVFAYDKVFNRIYDYAEDLGIPVMFHTGDTAKSIGSLKHSHPLTLDALANKRPDLKIVACHFGNPWMEDVGELLYKHPNFYADISGLISGSGGKYSEKYMDLLASKISGAIHYAGTAEKILFGTDYPVETFEQGIALTNMLAIDEEDRQRIFYSNAERLFFNGNRV